MEQSTLEHQILISTPAYSGMVHTDFVHSLLAFKAAGIQFSLQTVGNESLITRARNTLITNFWHFDQYTHILFLDGDVFLDSEALIEMLRFEKDVVGAPVYLKGGDRDGEQRLNTDAVPSDEGPLQQVTRVGTGALLLSRNAVNLLVEDALSQGEVYKANDEFNPENALPRHHFNIFRTGVLEDEYLSEDYWVCRKLRELGVDIHVHTGAYTRHNGVVAFD